MLSTREKATIEYHVEKQIQWLDANLDATLEELIKHKNRFEQIIAELINAINRRNPTSNETESFSHSYTDEL